MLTQNHLFDHVHWIVWKTCLITIKFVILILLLRKKWTLQVFWTYPWYPNEHFQCKLAMILCCLSSTLASLMHSGICSNWPQTLFPYSCYSHNWSLAYLLKHIELLTLILKSICDLFISTGWKLNVIKLREVQWKLQIKGLSAETEYLQNVYYPYYNTHY